MATTRPKHGNNKTKAWQQHGGVATTKQVKTRKSQQHREFDNYKHGVGNKRST
jgi:hypothetical protein